MRGRWGSRRSAGAGGAGTSAMPAGFTMRGGEHCRGPTGVVRCSPVTSCCKRSCTGRRGGATRARDRVGTGGHDFGEGRMKRLRLAVLMGGPSAEREVSLASGKMVVEALQPTSASVVPVVVDGPEFALPSNTDVAFIALHG